MLNKFMLASYVGMRCGIDAYGRCIKDMQINIGVYMLSWDTVDMPGRESRRPRECGKCKGHCVDLQFLS